LEGHGSIVGESSRKDIKDSKDIKDDKDTKRDTA
jgi:hypothetical protein